MNISLDRKHFGRFNGLDIFLFTIKNKKGMSVSITNYGGIITHLMVPDRNEVIADVVLGFDDLELYQKEHPYLGGIIGRYANRIALGRFTLDNKTVTLPVNSWPHSLHGGKNGFNKKVWAAKEIIKKNAKGIELNAMSVDGEEGYPGTLKMKVKYLLTERNELKIIYSVNTDKPTVVNLTNHPYFNLKGAGNGDILDHELKINADYFTPLDNTMIPTGEIKKVKNTPFDFTESIALGAMIDVENDQLNIGNGYDHNFVLNEYSNHLQKVASVKESNSGRIMEVFTTQPGLQLYTANSLDGSIIGKSEKKYEKRYGVCLETQHFPDSPNHSHFPSTRLGPEERYESQTVYKFSAE